MSTTELVPVRETTLELERQRFMPVMNIAMALERRAVIAEAVKSILVEGEDYGVIPGSTKPTLHQPGAQKLDNIFGLVPRYFIERADEDWTGERHGGEPFFRFMVRCQCMRGDFIMGEGLGECNSWESKYRYRNADRKCPDCGAAALIRGKQWKPTDPKQWVCFEKKGGCKAKFPIDDPAIMSQEVGRKPNPDIFDLVNTLLKMAEKRAHMLATINATSASEFFTQDLEDRAPEAEADTVQQNTDTEQAALAEKRIAEERSRKDAQQAAADDRPVPEELQLAFNQMRTDWSGKTMGEAFKLIDSCCESEAAKAIYAEHVQAYRAKFKPAQMSYANATTCLLDIWDALQKLTPVLEGYQWDPCTFEPDTETVLTLDGKELGRVIHFNTVWHVDLGNSIDGVERQTSRTSEQAAKEELIKRYEARKAKENA